MAQSQQAQQAQQAQQPEQSKLPTRFDKFMSGVGKTAEKFKKQAEKAAVNSKIKMQNKINNVQPTPEDQEIVNALERLKITKNEIASISENTRSLYGAYIEVVRQTSLLSGKLQDMKVEQNDTFAAYCKSLGETLSFIDASETDYAEKMMQHLVVPLEKFRDVDIDEVQAMKLKYKTLKSNYDIALANLGKANESQDHNKMALAIAKRDETKNELDAFRATFKLKIEKVEEKKNHELLIMIQEYWRSYTLYVNNLIKTINNKTPYVNKDFYNNKPIQPSSYQDDDEDEPPPPNNIPNTLPNNNNYNNYSNNNYNDNNNNNNNYNNNDNDYLINNENENNYNTNTEQQDENFDEPPPYDYNPDPNDAMPPPVPNQHTNSSNPFE